MYQSDTGITQHRRLLWLSVNYRRAGVSNPSEEVLLRFLHDKTARIQQMAEIEASRAIAGVSGNDLWPAKKVLIEQCDEILNRLEALYDQSSS